MKIPSTQSSGSFLRSPIILGGLVVVIVALIAMLALGVLSGDSGGGGGVRDEDSRHVLAEADRERRPSDRQGEVHRQRSQRPRERVPGARCAEEGR